MIRLLLVDDHALVREGIGSLLTKDAEVEVVGTAASGREAVALARQTRPDMVLMDVVMPDMGGIEASRRILDDNHDVKIIALSMYDSQACVSEMLEAGAVGYMLKNCVFEELTRAIRAARDGETYLCDSLSKRIVKEFVTKVRSEGPPPTGTSALSAREREVLRLLSEGKASKEIARRLGVRPKTVDSHRIHLMAKLKITSVAGLTKYAIREGLTSIDS